MFYQNSSHLKLFLFKYFGGTVNHRLGPTVLMLMNLIIVKTARSYYKEMYLSQNSTGSFCLYKLWKKLYSSVASPFQRGILFLYCTTHSAPLLIYLNFCMSNDHLRGPWTWKNPDRQNVSPNSNLVEVLNDF